MLAEGRRDRLKGIAQDELSVFTRLFEGVWEMSIPVTCVLGIAAIARTSCPKPQPGTAHVLAWQQSPENQRVQEMVLLCPMVCLLLVGGFPVHSLSERLGGPQASTQVGEM